MNKAELNEKWSKYCDVNQLVDDVRVLLTTHNHRNTEHGVCTLLDKFFANKESLIQLISTSSHYIGNLRIKATHSFDRAINYVDIRNFFYEHEEEFMLGECLQRVDADGKAMMEYMKADSKFINIFDAVDNKAMMEMSAKLRQFREDGVTVASYNRIYQHQRYLAHFKGFTHYAMQEDFIPVLDKKAPTLKAGTKTSRAFGAFCRYYGLDKKPTYNKTYAKYADLVSPLKRNMDFVISLNPLDYLMMSNGVSWHSCHNIRDGSYKGGCLSYMLDHTSLITFVVEDINSNSSIHLIPKNYRQMIHYKDGMFMQNRLYPQANDGATDLYSAFRGYVTEEFTEILGVESNWDVEQGSNACRNHVDSIGAHYRDYLSGFRTHIFYPHSKATDIAHKIMTVGHHGMCTYCGHEYTEWNRLAHSNCACSR